MYQQPRFLLGGDRALYVDLGDSISPELNQRVGSLVNAIDSASIPGIEDLSPTYRSILVYYDPLKITLDELKERLAASAREATKTPPKRSQVVEVPTAYGGEFGPDLGFVASHNRLTEEEVVRIHSGSDYLVYMLGFNPGFPYLGGLSERIATPRLNTPRVKIPAGSVGIAESQTGVYPLDSPGGWRLIGRTPIRIFDPTRDPPVIAQAGNYVRFVPVDEARYGEIEQQVKAGTYQVTTRETA
ncbi:MAG: 5-oxoprolinase subunit PxpB [Dehalococcoidia bacterium]